MAILHTWAKQELHPTSGRAIFKLCTFWTYLTLYSLPTPKLFCNFLRSYHLPLDLFLDRFNLLLNLLLINRSGIQCSEHFQLRRWLWERMRPLKVVSIISSHYWQAVTILLSYGPYWFLFLGLSLLSGIIPRWARELFGAPLLFSLIWSSKSLGTHHTGTSHPRGDLAYGTTSWHN